MRIVDYEEQEEDGEEYECPICKGRGCTVCSNTGKIVVGGSGQVRSSPKIILETNEIEKDKFAVQVGRLQLNSPIAQKEYSAAFTFYKELQEMGEKLEGDEFKDAFLELVDELREWRIDGLDPVSKSLDFINDLKSANAHFIDRLRVMATHFELALEVMARDARAREDKHRETELEYKQLKQAIMRFNNEADKQESNEPPRREERPQRRFPDQEGKRPQGRPPRRQEPPKEKNVLPPAEEIGEQEEEPAEEPQEPRKEGETPAYDEY